jgi:plastocyanin
VIRARTALAAAAATAAACAALLPVVGAQAGSTVGRPQKKTVKIADDYYGPAKLTVNYGSTITWKWPTDVGDTHDVALKKGPTGAKKFQSESFATGATYRQKLTRPGVYRIYCTFHETEMTMTITVRKKPR